MRLPYRLTLILFCLASALIHVTAQQSPCMCLHTENRACNTQSSTTFSTPFSHNSRSIGLEISDDPQTLDPFAGARYKAFWIFGDGNFAYFPHQIAEQDRLTLRQNYTYRRSGRYTSEAVLSEKKSNTRPPVRDRRIIQIGTNVAPGSGTPFVQQLAGNVQTADILPSDSMRPHRYLTAFAVSAPKHEANSGIYFFFNSKVGGGTSQAAPMHALVDVNLPDYAGTNYTHGLTSSLTNQLGIELRREFNNYVFVPINSSNFGSMPPDADFNEYRIFPILETIWSLELPKCRFLAVIVGNRAVYDKQKGSAQDPVPNDFFTLKKLAELERLSGVHFNEIMLDSPAYFDSTQSPVFIRGIHEVDVPMVGSIDPNELEVMSICPLKDGQYEVKMRVQVCNRGIISVSPVPVRLIDHTGGQFSDFNFLPEFANLTPTLTRDNATHTWKFVHAGLVGVSTPEDLGADNVAKPYEPQCMEVFFTLKTGIEGVRKLLSGEALECCATFPGANFPDECHFNFPIDESRFTPRNGFNCGTDKSENPVDNECGLLCILLILVLLAILMWWFFKRND